MLAMSFPVVFSSGKEVIVNGPTIITIDYGEHTVTVVHGDNFDIEGIRVTESELAIKQAVALKDITGL